MTATAGGTGVTTIDGCRLSYRRAGTEGPPVVLLHGGGIDDATLSWRHTIDDLADDYRVYAPDWPGYGDSDDGLAHSTESYVAILEAFLDNVGLGEDEPVILAGISMGGAAALGYTLDHPERVRQLILVDSYGLGRHIPAGSLWKTLAHVPGANALGWATLGTSHEAARMGLGNVVADAGSLPEAFVEEFYERARTSGAGRAFEAFQRVELAGDGTALTNYADRLETLSVPTLLVHGAEDPLFPVEWSVRAAEKLPNARLEILENCGHWPTRERPDEFNGILRAFLERSH
ncbi:alpha/beta hydrolase [Halobacteria archaeon AArc-m2/3/4]|uniref:Alpha/beta hydrolase n=1 Tax=Natronoglomus mannanivorans TaxID=2979990 RepID=A0ABT2Q8D4_9EURY|nr:alpha/beta hydrolase [Halobacteria archaeon AArc-m2/3/4]